MKRRFPHYPLLVAGVLGLAFAASPLLAQPGNSQGNAQGAAPWKEQGHPQRGQKGQGGPQKSHGQGQARGERDRQESRDRVGEEYRDRERDAYRDRDEYRERYRDEARRPIIDERRIRDIFRERREFIRHDDRDRLPPGIRMNLERGKPLPPGIAKQFDARVRRDLPTYEGYEWRRVGDDAVLVDLTNDIIREVVHDILR